MYKAKNANLNVPIYIGTPQLHESHAQDMTSRYSKMVQPISQSFFWALIIGVDRQVHCAKYVVQILILFYNVICETSCLNQCRITKNSTTIPIV